MKELGELKENFLCWQTIFLAIIKDINLDSIPLPDNFNIPNHNITKIPKIKEYIILYMDIINKEKK